MCQVLLYRIIALSETWLLYFNSHAHVERDIMCRTKSDTDTISTHTLTWSVTWSDMSLDWLRRYFNSHAHVERDTVVSRRAQLKWRISTHTLTWSVTSSIVFLSQLMSFQLTRSRGAWLAQKCSFNVFNISTHTLTWSVTTTSLKTTVTRCNFNSHAHVERDYAIVILVYFQKTFQLTRSRGAWPLWPQEACNVVIFQLTRSRGAWRGW